MNRLFGCGGNRQEQENVIENNQAEFEAHYLLHGTHEGHAGASSNAGASNTTQEECSQCVAANTKISDLTKKNKQMEEKCEELQKMQCANEQEIQELKSSIEQKDKQIGKKTNSKKEMLERDDEIQKDEKISKKEQENKKNGRQNDELHKEIQYIKSLVKQKNEEIKLKDEQIRKLSESKREMEERSAHELHMEEIKRCIQKKDEEIQQLNSLLKGHTKKWNQIKLEAHEDINKDYSKYYKWIEFNLPMILKEMDKREIWKHFCNVYRTSFLQCREAIHKVFMESLVTLTELSEEEEQTGKINLDRREELEHMTAAYRYLLKHCAPRLDPKVVDLNSIVENIMTTAQVDGIPGEILREQTLKAVDICWRMQTVSPPMFLCQPKLFSDEWHGFHRNSWYDKEDELVYYKPVLMYSAGGDIASKGFVGNKPPVEQIPDVNVSDNQATPPAVKLEKVITHCSSCNKEVDSCANLQLTGGFCDNCYHINTTCNKCSKQLTPTDTHWYGGKVWHKDCFPVRYCSKYQCNKEPAELKDMISVQDGKFCYHKGCYTCSVCGSNDVDCVSSDGQTIWCRPCYQQHGRCCCYCQTVFQQEMKFIAYPQIQRKLVCEECSNKIHQRICFTCGKIIEKADLAETNTGIYHSSCPKYGTCNKCNQYLTSTDKHWYKGKLWHQACLPVMYSCSKYRCNKESAELEHTCMIQFGNFYYHCDECFTCSHCKRNEIAQVSGDGKTLWCKSCWEHLSTQCFDCQRLFHNGMQLFVPPRLLGKIICELCCNKLRDLSCFTCNTKTEDQKDHCMVETSTGIYHSSCGICTCMYSIKRGQRRWTM